MLWVMVLFVIPGARLVGLDIDRYRKTGRNPGWKTFAGAGLLILSIIIVMTPGPVSLVWDNLR